MSSSIENFGSTLAGGAGEYSAVVRLSLRMADIKLRPTQVGGGRIYFGEPTMVPAGPAELVVEVDGGERRKAVVVHEAKQPCRVVGYSPST